MPRERTSLWIPWAPMLLALGAYPLLAGGIPPRAVPWTKGRRVVVGGAAVRCAIHAPRDWIFTRRAAAPARG